MFQVLKGQHLSIFVIVIHYKSKYIIKIITYQQLKQYLTITTDADLLCMKEVSLA